MRTKLIFQLSNSTYLSFFGIYIIIFATCYDGIQGTTHNKKILSGFDQPRDQD